VPRLSCKIGVVCAVAWAVAGCSGNNPLLEKETYSSMFSKPSRLFDLSDFTKSDFNRDAVNLGPSGPVAPEDLVSADGGCAAETVQATPQPQAAEPQAQTAAAPPADRPVGSFAGDLAGAPMAAAPPAAIQVSAPPPDRLQPEGLAGGGPSLPPVMGGVALGMSECQVVRRAGTPSNVSIGTDAKGERKVVLTYAGGNWPGVYRFESGRLDVIEGLPQTQTAKSKSRRKPVSTRSARQGSGRVYVQ